MKNRQEVPLNTRPPKFIHLLSLAVLLMYCGSAFAGSTVIHQVKNDTSPALSSMVSAGSGNVTVAGDNSGNMNLARPTGPQISAGVADPVAQRRQVGSAR